MISGSSVVGRMRILEEGLGATGGKVCGFSSINSGVEVVAFLGLHVSSSSPTSSKSRPFKSEIIINRN